MRLVLLLVLASVVGSLSVRPSFAQGDAPKPSGTSPDDGAAGPTRSGAPDPPVAPKQDAVGVTVVEADEAQRAAAEMSFYAGDEAFDVQKYQLALKFFQESNEIVPSQNTRLMIARSLLELGRLDESYEAYMAILAEPQVGEHYARSQAIAKKERSALLSRLGWLTVDLGELPAESQLQVGGRLRHPGGQNDAIAVTPGETLVKATSPDGQEAHAIIHLAAGREARVILKLGETITVRAAEVDSPEVGATTQADTAPVVTSREGEAREGMNLRSWAYGAGALGLAGAVTFGVFGWSSGKKYRALEGECEGSICPQGYQDDIDAGRRAQNIANIGLGVGLVGFAGSVVLFSLDARHRAVSLNLGPRGVLVRGAF